ncbi:MAG TPA: endonuclease/exonuclease/phosphatase family protein [Solimonas sp.]|nr:endonuclease/exonuclease/phosphatase family protein [Solimonas sp.]
MQADPCNGHDSGRLKLLTFNMQVGLQTQRYSHYLSRAWRHALPSAGARTGLASAAELVRGFDFVAIQEADAGSLRTRFVNQIEYLAEHGGYAHHGFGVTRDLRPMARHCLGFLSRHPARIIDDHALPGLLPGRRALQVELEVGGASLQVFVVHLALGQGTQRQQLHHIAELVSPEQPTVIMGDFNCDSASLRRHPALRRAGFWIADDTPLTYPSWSPRRSIDHILLSPALELHRLQALPPTLSDHLPLTAEIGLRPQRLPS